MGELHLEILTDRLKKDFKVDADLGPVRISYRESLDLGESISKPFVFEKEIQGKSMTAEMLIKIEKLDLDNNSININIEEKEIPNSITSFFFLSFFFQISLILFPFFEKK